MDNSKMAALITTARAAALDDVPCCGIEDEPDLDGHPVRTGHWNSTLDEMKKFLGVEKLSDEQITCLSLSRAFGPCPSLDNEDVLAAIEYLFPAGNPSGSWYTWIELAGKLEKMTIVRFVREGPIVLTKEEHAVYLATRGGDCHVEPRACILTGKDVVAVINGHYISTGCHPGYMQRHLLPLPKGVKVETLTPKYKLGKYAQWGDVYEVGTRLYRVSEDYSGSAVYIQEFDPKDLKYYDGK